MCIITDSAKYSLYFNLNLFNDVNVYLSPDFTSIGIILCFDVILSVEIKKSTSIVSLLFSLSFLEKKYSFRPELTSI